MEELSLKMIFLAHPAKFFCASVKKFTEEQGPQVYILDEYEDFEYLVEDLKPQVICADSGILNKYNESFHQSVQRRDVKLIELISNEEDPVLNDYIKLPIEASEFLNLVKSKIE